MTHREKATEPLGKSKEFRVLFGGGSSPNFMEAEQNIESRFSTHGLSEFLSGRQPPNYEEEEPRFRY